MEEPFQPLTVGYAWFFENIVVFDPRGASSMLSFLAGSKHKKLGEFLGVVKALIPTHPYYILYEYLRNTKGYKQRQKEARVLRRLGLSRREMKFMKQHGQQKLAVRIKKV